MNIVLQSRDSTENSFGFKNILNDLISDVIKSLGLQKKKKTLQDFCKICLHHRRHQNKKSKVIKFERVMGDKYRSIGRVLSLASLHVHITLSISLSLTAVFIVNDWIWPESTRESPITYVPNHAWYLFTHDLNPFSFINCHTYYFMNFYLILLKEVGTVYI